MGQKYLPTIRDQKAAQRFQWQQRQRTQKEQAESAPAAEPPAKPVATKADTPKRGAK